MEARNIKGYRYICWYWYVNINRLITIGFKMKYLIILHTKSPDYLLCLPSLCWEEYLSGRDWYLIANGLSSHHKVCMWTNVYFTWVVKNSLNMMKKVFFPVTNQSLFIMFVIWCHYWHHYYDTVVSLVVLFCIVGNTKVHLSYSFCYFMLSWIWTVFSILWLFCIVSHFMSLAYTCTLHFIETINMKTYCLDVLWLLSPTHNAILVHELWLNACIPLTWVHCDNSVATFARCDGLVWFALFNDTWSQ